jgi:hypothetical protein
MTCSLALFVSTIGQSLFFARVSPHCSVLPQTFKKACKSSSTKLAARRATRDAFDLARWRSSRQSSGYVLLAQADVGVVSRPNSRALL